ncbi:MAG: PP2C family protein-serine/threonine phosphatase [Pirellulales bacterium]
MNSPLNNDWQVRLAQIVETMRELSLQTDPQEMVRTYGARMQALFPSAKRISLSRRNLSDGQFRITRHTDWPDEINPWKQPDKLPLLTGGILGELIYGDQPKVLNDVRIPESDPASSYLQGARSLLALPLFDKGTSLNMVVSTRNEPHAFEESDLPERVWMANLFGRAANNLVLAEQLDEAYRKIDHELKVVADIQRSLLPKAIPAMKTMRVAAHYETSRHAGGDYYDFFQLPRDRWGILIADVSGHGAPAAVVMAVLHSLAHMYPGEPTRPSQLLNHLNRHLTERYTLESGHFVTAFYAIYDETTRELTYSAAGHNPPRLQRCGESCVSALEEARDLPLGFLDEVEYQDHSIILKPGDRIAFYTDGITEAFSPSGEQFGTDRLDTVLGQCCRDADKSLRRVLDELSRFTEGAAPSDDQTLLVADVF